VAARQPRTLGQKIMMWAIALVVASLLLGLAARWFLSTVDTPTRIEERISS
jgi:hypothetical protein